MKVEFNYLNTSKHTDKAFYLTPSIAIYIYNGVSIKSYIICFSWLVFSFSMNININKK